MQNLWIFNARGFLLVALTLNLRLFYGSLRSFFAWLGFARFLWLAFLPAFSLNKKATAWLLPYPVILSVAKYPQNFKYGFA